MHIKRCIKATIHNGLFGTATSVLFVAGLCAQPKVIPVVYHVLHNNGPENISVEQILDQIEQMNVTFGSGPAFPPVPPFDEVAASLDVLFCLATLDPNGMPTTGIERIASEYTYAGGDPASYVQQWPPDRYLNVWTVSTMAVSGPAFSSLLPAEAEQQPSMDGIVIRHDYVGRLGTSNPQRGVGAITRFARFLNLKMMCEDPTGQGNCHDDEVADTPPCAPDVQCTLPWESCDPGVPVNVQNYMHLGGCMTMFTQGQRERVHACLNSGTANRSMLWSAQNLVSTGCDAMVGLGDDRAVNASVVFPNPFSDELSISLAQKGAVDIVLVDALGRVVLSDRIVVDTREPVRLGGISALVAGPYWLRVSSLGSEGTVHLVLKH
ncbi:MAG: zinc-dependent metalloprotease [Flavobacteriales bacterium]|nr:zinc-dependent metalloprotease [Flavobacteriales bacterium]